MIARCFVDSNVLIYARDVVEPAKQRRANDWLTWLWNTGRGRLSYQVIIESYAVLTATPKVRLQRAKARAFLEDFLRWEPLVLDSVILNRAWRIQDHYGFNWWDCLILAAAQVSACTHLLTEDMQHGQNLDGLIVVNPFEAEPESTA